MAEAASRRAPRTWINPRTYYGWYIVYAGMGLQLLQNALLGAAYGSYVVVLREQFGWSKTALSGAAALREVESGVTGPIQGWLLDRLGARRVISIGLLILGGGLMLFSQVQTLWQFYGAFFIMALGGSLMGWTSITWACVQWFERRRSTAISLTSAGFALGGMTVYFVAYCIETFGWRETAFVSGIILIVTGLPLARVFRSSPAEVGLGIDGDALDADGVAIRPLHAPPPQETVDFTVREALRTPAFYWVGLGHASALFIVSAMNVHLQSHLKESLGWSLGQASSIAVLLAFVQLGGTLTGGPLGDRVSKRWLCTVCMAMHVGGLLVLAHAANLLMVIGFTVLHGLAWGWRGPQMAAIRADYFGRANFGKILGLSNMLIIIGTVLGPLIAGWMYDATGDYRLGFDILSGIAAAGSIFFVLARKPAPPPRTRIATA
jgi:MFS family permease